MKYQLPGPMTMADTLADEHYRDREALAMAFAEILNAEAKELAAAGVSVIQFDEPAGGYCCEVGVLIATEGERSGSRVALVLGGRLVSREPEPRP